jgi:hypothetical protein
MLLAVVCFAAGALRLRRRAPVTVLFILAYVAVTLVWPYASWRFVWGVWPLVLLFVAAGAEWLVRWRPRDRSLAIVRLAPLAIVAVLAAGLLRAEIATYRDRAWFSPVRDATRAIAPAMRWIGKNTLPHEAVIADAEPLVYLYAQRQAIPPVEFTADEYIAPRRRAADAAALADLVRRYPVRFIVTVVPSTAEAARTLATPAAGRGFFLRQADTLPGGAVFEVARQ